jgi:hypothetical protein
LPLATSASTAPPVVQKPPAVLQLPLHWAPIASKAAAAGPLTAAGPAWYGEGVEGPGGAFLGAAAEA